MKNYDAIVIGGGPGGSSAAGFLAQKGYKVALFEKEKFPRYHIGESLLPATTMGLMQKLGAKELIEAQGFPRKFGGTFRWGAKKEPWTFFFYKTGDEGRKLEGNPEALYSFQVRRAKYDELILRHVQSLGVEVVEEAALAGLEDADKPLKTVLIRSKDGSVERFQAPFLVDASGRGSTINKHVGERHYDPFFRNVALWSYFENGKRLSDDKKGNIFCEAFSHGWFWYIPLSDTLTSVGVVMDRRAYDEKKHAAPEALFAEMVEKAPYVRDLLAPAKRCETAPYDAFRTAIDYSYIHSRFAKDGIFLVGDAACFIDPVFSSGVHLATYSGYQAAGAVDDVVKGRATLDAASESFENLYRKEYMVFHRFLNSFYQLHVDESSYFWEARKVLDREGGTDHDAFIRIVSGSATGGMSLFDSMPAYRENIEKGKKSLDVMVERVSGGDQNVTDEEFAQALDYIKPSKDSGHRLTVEAAEALKK